MAFVFVNIIGAGTVADVGETSDVLIIKKSIHKIFSNTLLSDPGIAIHNVYSNELELVNSFWVFKSSHKLISDIVYSSITNSTRHALLSGTLTLIKNIHVRDSEHKVKSSTLLLGTNLQISNSIHKQYFKSDVLVTRTDYLQVKYENTILETKYQNRILETNYQNRVLETERGE